MFNISFFSKILGSQGICKFLFKFLLISIPLRFLTRKILIFDHFFSLQNQNEIKPDSRVTSEVSEDFVVLMNKKSKREDSGRYSLKLANSQGTDSASCKVTVVGE